MTRRRTARVTVAIALGAVVIVAIVAAGILVAFNQANPGVPNHSTAQPVSATRTSGIWNFAVTINASSIKQGQYVGLVAQLTNTGSTNQTIRNFVGPYVNPQVYAANGTEVWVWNPPQSTWPTWTFPSGQVFPQPVSIPTSQLSTGQTYTVKIAPLSEDIPAQDNLIITLQFSVH